MWMVYGVRGITLTNDQSNNCDDEYYVNCSCTIYNDVVKSLSMNCAYPTNLTTFPEISFNFTHFNGVAIGTYEWPKDICNSKSTGNISIITHLDLSNNRLREIPYDLTFCLKNLEVLRLNGNRIEKITLLNWMNSLKELDISGNLIKHLNLNFIHHQIHLQSVKLSENQITEIRWPIYFNHFIPLMYLCYIDFSSNLISTISFDIIQTTSISSNIIVDVRNCGKDMIIDFSDNPICFVKEKFSELFNRLTIYRRLSSSDGNYFIFDLTQNNCSFCPYDPNEQLSNIDHCETMTKWKNEMKDISLQLDDCQNSTIDNCKKDPKIYEEVKTTTTTISMTTTNVGRRKLMKFYFIGVSFVFYKCLLFNFHLY
ncbi:hypothetical protein SNEBB_000574 [Seison nebaliae]|nr:hypothetical protein SNEBB_000574 [Seison nebaliae]